MSQMRFQIYSEDIKKDELFLKVIGDKALSKDSDFSDFLAAYNWFKKIEVVYPNSHARNQKDFFLNAPTNTDSFANMLRLFDTGIQEVKRGKQSAEKAFSFLPDDIRKDILNDIMQKANEMLQNGSSVKVEIGQYQFDISIENGEIMAEKCCLTMEMNQSCLK